MNRSPVRFRRGGDKKWHNEGKPRQMKPSPRRAKKAKPSVNIPQARHVHFSLLLSSLLSCLRVCLRRSVRLSFPVHGRPTPTPPPQAQYCAPAPSAPRESTSSCVVGPATNTHHRPDAAARGPPPPRPSRRPRCVCVFGFLFEHNVCLVFRGRGRRRCA